MNPCPVPTNSDDFRCSIEPLLPMRFFHNKAKPQQESGHSRFTEASHAPPRTTMTGALSPPPIRHQAGFDQRESRCGPRRLKPVTRESRSTEKSRGGWLDTGSSLLKSAKERRLHAYQPLSKAFLPWQSANEYVIPKRHFSSRDLRDALIRPLLTRSRLRERGAPDSRKQLSQVS